MERRPAAQPCCLTQRQRRIQRQSRVDTGKRTVVITENHGNTECPSLSGCDRSCLNGHEFHGPPGLTLPYVVWKKHLLGL